MCNKTICTGNWCRNFGTEPECFECMSDAEVQSTYEDGMDSPSMWEELQQRGIRPLNNLEKIHKLFKDATPDEFREKAKAVHDAGEQSGHSCSSEMSFDELLEELFLL